MNILTYRQGSVGFARLTYVFAMFAVVWPVCAVSQVESPTDKYLFQKDHQSFEKERSKKIKQLLQSDPAAPGHLDVRAPEMEYLQGTDKIRGSGGLIVSGEGVQIQADEGVVDTKTRDAQLSGNFLMSAADGELAADTADMNIDSETGEFSDADFSMVDGEYRVLSETAKKLSEFEYELDESNFSTCHCVDGSLPWCLRSSRAHITEEAYAHTYHTRLKLWDVPVLYSPWVAFPVKRERASGLLAPTYGYSGEDGFLMELPFFAVIDDHSDFMFTPFVETKTRRGLGVDYREAFSRYSNVEGRLIYSDERPRDGSLRGTNVDGLDDPTFEEDRLGGYYSQAWRASPDFALPLSFFADIHLVNDDLFLREIEDEDIGKRNARYTVSTVSLRSPIGEYLASELVSEYNQAMISDDDVVFQRLPVFNLSGSRSVRPFGFNPYGIKFILGGGYTSSNFYREEGYDGWRHDLNPKIRMPLHYKNYFSSDLTVGYRTTYYDLDETLVPDSETELDGTNDRSIFTLDYQVATELERVFDVEPDNWFVYLTSLGVKNQQNRLRRMKHDIEPYVKYAYVPEEDQDDLPLFDSQDRIRERSLFTYGIRQSLLGRFGPKTAGAENIAELTPRLEDIPTLDTSAPLSDVDESEVFGTLGVASPIVKGLIREVAAFEVKQAYDYREDRENNNPEQSPWSDVGASVGFYPTLDFAMKFATNYNAEEHDVSSWSYANHFKTDRGDILRARYTFVDNSVSQIEGNLEIVLTDRFKIGTYARFDEEESEFIENQVALRVESGCNCWHVDIGYTSRINPDKDQFLVTFTLKGLGDVTQDFRVDEEENT